ncbi:hypothetical protein BJX65DRAFT_296904 [Aspergillus insuetus]
MDSLHSTSNAFQPSISSLSPFVFSSAGSGSGDPLARLAQELEQRPFTSDDSLRISLEQRRQALHGDQTRDQYLVFTSVPPAVASNLSDDASPTSKYCRFYFNAEMGILVERICPNDAHEGAKRAFDMLIFRELHAMHLDEDVTPLGSTTVTVGDWTKEADCCWAPDSTSTRLTFIVEVGLSESPPFSAGRTAFVKISRENNATSITGESHVNGTTTTITQLDLPFEKIVDCPPCQPTERCLSISEHRLRFFAERIWSEQGLIP